MNAYKDKQMHQWVDKLLENAMPLITIYNGRGIETDDMTTIQCRTQWTQQIANINEKCWQQMQPTLPYSKKEHRNGKKQ